VVHLPNSPDFLIAHLAISKLGGIISTMHMPYARADIKNALEEKRLNLHLSLLNQGIRILTLLNYLKSFQMKLEYHLDLFSVQKRISRAIPLLKEYIKIPI
ncbi:hypothetical protein SE19_06135, partial [Acidiplasma aeolicum]